MDAVNAHPALIALNLLPLANKDPSKINRTDIAHGLIESTIAALIIVISDKVFNFSKGEI